MENCYCGSSKSYSLCCGRLHKGELNASTAKELMKSRYSAFASGEIDYILNTEILSTPNNHEDLRKWCASTEWEKLEIIQTTAGKENDYEGTVTFHAFYHENQISYQLTETSKFKKIDDSWMYVGGNAKFIKLPVIQNQEIGRNDPCPCNSGKKYKKCCGA